jgi:hypothetical protein
MLLFRTIFKIAVVTKPVPNGFKSSKGAAASIVNVLIEPSHGHRLSIALYLNFYLIDKFNNVHGFDHI